MDQGQMSKDYPRPPPFYTFFSSENLAELQQQKDQNLASIIVVTTRQDNFVNHLPTHLQYLLPPAPPDDGLYLVFGEQANINHALPMLPKIVERLASHELQQAERASELHVYARSLLLKFLDVVGILSTDQALAVSSINDLRLLFFSSHQLINEYRPHQARETLIKMLEDCLQRKRAEVEVVKLIKLRLDKLLSEVESHESTRSLTTNNCKINLPISGSEEHQLRLILDSIKI